MSNEKTNEVPLVETEEVKPVKKTKTKEKPEDYGDYQRFAELKFLMWNGETRTFERKRLKPQTLELFDSLEKKFKTYKGKKPNRNATAFLGVGEGVGRVVEGYGVPESLHKKFKEAGIADRYFG